jgi:hypothetical protein
MLIVAGADPHARTEGRVRRHRCNCIGWNQVEYRAPDGRFGNRSARKGEQIELLRAVWTERGIAYKRRPMASHRRGAAI